MKRFLMCVLMAIFVCSLGAAFAEQEGKYLKAEETRYVKWSMQKYGETIEAVCNENSRTDMTVDVLPWTEWAISAELTVVTEDEPLPEISDVTGGCTWKSSNTDVVRCDGNKITIYGNSGTGSVTSKYTDSEGNTYSAAITFNIQPLSMQLTDELRCTAALMLAKEGDKLSYCKNDSIQKIAEGMARSNKGVNNVPLSPDSFLENSATRNHLIYYAFPNARLTEWYRRRVGRYTYDVIRIRAADKDFVAFSVVNDCALSVSDLQALCWDAQHVYALTGSDYRPTVLTGIEADGAMAQYASITTGGDAITFLAGGFTKDVFKYASEEYPFKVAAHYTGDSIKSYSTSNPRLALDYYPDTETVTTSFTGLSRDTSFNYVNHFYATGKRDSVRMDKNAVNHRIYLGNGNDVLNCTSSAGTVVANITDIASASGTGIDALKLMHCLSGLMDWSEMSLKSAGGLAYLLSGAKFVSDQQPNYISGGKGNDTLNGSDNDDIYVYTYGDGVDVINDFSGDDKLYLVDCGGRSVTFEQLGDYRLILIDGIRAIELNVARYCTYKLIDQDGFKIYVGEPGNCKPLVDEIIRKPMIPAAIDLFTAACPVDMEIIDKNGNVVRTLYDGQVASYVEDYGLLFVEQMDNGEYIKCAALVDPAYTIRLVGVGEGSMDYLAMTYNPDTQSESTVTLCNVPVQDGALYYPTDDYTSDSILDADWDGNGTIDQTIGNTTEITLPEEKITLAYGEMLQLDPTVVSDGCSLIWMSNDPGVVTVDENGLLTAVGFGESNVGVIADNGSGAYAICTVTVPEETLSIKDCDIHGVDSSYTYTGKAIRPEVSVVYKSLQLTQGVDYCLTYSDYLFPGTATVTIEGVGRFTGSVPLQYLIYEETFSSVEEVVARVAAECEAQGFTTEYDKALWLHDWLVYHANYDYTYTYYGADGVLLKKTGVCQSYTLAYQLLLDAVGIENDTIAAPVEMNHTWNVAKIDGEWCHIDCTWNDPGTGGLEHYMYFGMNTELMSRDHDWPESENRYACTSLQNYYYLRVGAECCETAEDVYAYLDRLADAQTADIFIAYTGSDPDFYLPDVFDQWYAENNWKYGVKSSSGWFSDYHARFTLTYTDPWTGYEGLDTPVPCPDFTLSSPRGVYRLSDYASNGLVLIFGRDGCLNTHGLMDRLHSELDLLNSGGVDVIISLDAAESIEDFDAVRSEYPNFKYAYDGFNDGTMFDFIEAVGDEPYNIIYPLVFIINSDGMITYYSSGYVYNVDALVSEAFKTATGHVLPEPRIEIPENLDNVTVPDEWKGDALKTLFNLSAGHDGTLFLYDYGAEYSKTVDTLESWTRKKELVDRLNLKLAVCYMNISDDVLAQYKEAYPDVTFIPDDGRVMWEMLAAVGWDMTQPAYYLGGYLINSDGYIIDYRNGDIYSTQETISRFAFTNDLMFTIPSGLTTIDSDTFSGIAATSVDLTTASLRTINDRAFSDCPNLRFIRIPSTVIHIADNAFDGFTNVTFICDYGSAAYEYALTYNIPCITRY